jgi:hypothetical protein
VLKDVQDSLAFTKEDYEVYEAIENSRSATKEPHFFTELDLVTAAPLRFRLEDTGKVFSLDNAYKVIGEDGGYVAIDKTRAPKTNRTITVEDERPAAVAPAAAVDNAPPPPGPRPYDFSKGNLLKLFFGAKGSDFDVLLRDLHPIFFTRNLWLTVGDYALSLSSYLACDAIKICTAFELVIYFRLYFKKKSEGFFGHNAMCNIIMKITSIRGSFKDTNLFQLYTTLITFSLKVLEVIHNTVLILPSFSCYALSHLCFNYLSDMNCRNL